MKAIHRRIFLAIVENEYLVQIAFINASTIILEVPSYRQYIPIHISHVNNKKYISKIIYLVTIIQLIIAMAVVDSIQ